MVQESQCIFNEFPKSPPTSVSLPSPAWSVFPLHLSPPSPPEPLSLGYDSQVLAIVLTHHMPLSWVYLFFFEDNQRKHKLQIGIKHFGWFQVKLYPWPVDPRHHPLPHKGPSWGEAGDDIESTQWKYEPAVGSERGRWDAPEISVALKFQVILS